MDCVFDLAKDPGIGHRTATNQDSIAPSFTKSIECLLNGGDITAARHRDADNFFNLPDQIPVSQTSVPLFLCAAV